ncbi:hypothetical protein TcasGA2_TC033025 [Tribolium castaneum]|uniref:Uncharacterized protein n=1 Tax=Tribolium castaneum TaxID=7070 RepID=A0A139WHU0_TRICA|nr:hypothetical protein TcasGA2_TC033025 [Tribolium castaneum]
MQASVDDEMNHSRLSDAKKGNNLTPAVFYLLGFLE